MKLFTGKRLTLLESLILVCFAALLLVVGIPTLLSARIGTNEQEARTFLRRIGRAEDFFQRNAILDANQNSTGEYGVLSEIFENPLPSSKELRLESKEISAAKERIAPQDVQWEQGGEIVRYSGYFFRVFLPHAPGRDDTPDARLAEKMWVAYAWPVTFARSGRKAFCIHKSGKILESANQKTRYEGKDSPPSSLAAFRKGAVSLFDPLASGEEGVDGQLWQESLH